MNNQPFWSEHDEKRRNELIEYKEWCTAHRKYMAPDKQDELFALSEKLWKSAGHPCIRGYKHPIEFLREIKILKEGYTEWMIQFSDKSSVNIVEMMHTFSIELAKDFANFCRIYEKKYPNEINLTSQLWNKYTAGNPFEKQP